MLLPCVYLQFFMGMHASSFDYGVYIALGTISFLGDYYFINTDTHPTISVYVNFIK